MAENRPRNYVPCTCENDVVNKKQKRFYKRLLVLRSPSFLPFYTHHTKNLIPSSSSPSRNSASYLNYIKFIIFSLFFIKYACIQEPF